jgi:hypothetical protein
METTYAYLAGVIDIDGFISVARRPSRRGEGQAGYYARIGLSDTSPVVPKLLHALFPGRLSEVTEKIVIFPLLFMGGRAPSGARAATPPVASFQTETAPRGTRTRADGSGGAAERRAVDAQAIERGARRCKASLIRGSCASQCNAQSPKTSCRGAANLRAPWAPLSVE